MAQLHRRVSVLVALPLILTLGACASMGSPSIEQVQSNPGRYANRTVTLNGTVTTAWGVPLVPYKMYRVSDGNSEILVLSNGNRLKAEVKKYSPPVSTEPGAMSVSPEPIEFEQAEPGGVSFTKRSSSVTWWSWSALKPACSV